MPTLLDTGLTPQTPKTSSMLNLDAILGAAVFDLNGLPKEYFITDESSDTSWVQTIFQVLGLRSLLISSLQLEGFCHATIRGTEQWAIVVKQRSYYLALLIKPQEENNSQDLIRFAQTLQPSDLRTIPGFQKE
jgi:hypothetical protein